MSSGLAGSANGLPHNRVRDKHQLVRPLSMLAKRSRPDAGTNSTASRAFNASSPTWAKSKNHSSEALKNKGDLWRQQCGYSCSTFSREYSKSPKAVKTASVASAIGMPLSSPARYRPVASIKLSTAKPNVSPTRKSSMPKLGARCTRPVPALLT